MNPRILVITGPLGGATIPLGESITLGRGEGCTVRIRQGSVSRSHCTIERIGDKFKITDSSSHGTFVNQSPIKEQFLVHGDQIGVGNSTLLFLTDDADQPSDGEALEINNSALITYSGIGLQKGSSSYLNVESPVLDAKSAARLVEDLRVLLSISASINTSRSLSALQEDLLKSVFEIAPADRGAIIFTRHSLDEWTSVFSRDRDGATKQRVSVSRTIVQEVIQNRIAVHSNDVADADAYSNSASLVDAQTRSLLCVPLLKGEHVFGVMYLTSDRPQASFDQRHLELVTAIANISAPVFESIRNLEMLQGERDRMRDELRLSQTMIGDSPKIQDVFWKIRKAAPTDSNVLIRGESGTGKELVARAIHENSERADQPFIAINCAALMDTLLESELFGHERGAFTGAIAQKKGKLEIADRGTLFLDEIGELTPPLQAKLLRFLQERAFERVGGVRSIRVDIRIIAATNRNLSEDIAKGAFREDLFYRLNVIDIAMPPLRERREDIPLLAQYFTAKYANKCKRRVEGLSSEAYACLLSYHWPGNVRELENAIERAVVLGSQIMIAPEDLPETTRKNGLINQTSNLSFYETLKVTKKQLILNAFDAAGDSHHEAAKLLGIHPNNLHRLLRTLKLKDLDGK